MTGKVVICNAAKGFGVIRPDDGSSDLFFDTKHVNRPVKAWDSVLYELQRGPQGLEAINIFRYLCR